MSALSNLAGLFPPKGGQIWMKNMPWQPIPIHSRPLKDDNYLALLKPCPRFDQIYATQSASFMNMLHTEYRDFIRMVEDKTGYALKSPMDLYSLYDCLLVEKIHGLTWNHWAYTPGVVNELHKLYIDVINRFFVGTHEMIRLKGGVLLKKMLTNMEVARSQAFPKMYMYSAHDSTVATVLAAMTVYNKLMPPYASVVMVELHEIHNDYVVKVFYRNDTSVKPYELILDDCNSPCILDSFIMAVAEFIPNDWDAECQG